MTEPVIGAGGQGADGAPSPHWPRELDADYEQLGELGRGGMAVVFRARDRALGRDVAIKVVRPRFAADEEAVARLAREARTVAQLAHPNIVGVYSIRHLSDGALALVMQLVPGRTLKLALQEDGPFDPSRAERVLRDIARALAYAHNAGVIHRDVKPENIFLDGITGRALLSDFGVARVMDAPTELTATGTTIGTPTYMAPEQIDGLHIDGRSDLYSLGIVGWEMLSGQRPWAGESLYNVIYRQKHDPLPPLESFRNDVPARFQYLIEGLMHKSPDRRWNSAARFLTLLFSDQALPGFREWQSAQLRRRRSTVYQKARSRGESLVDATLETMKFKRPTASDVASAPATQDLAPPPPAVQELASLVGDDRSPSAVGERRTREQQIFVVPPRVAQRRSVFAAAAIFVFLGTAAIWFALRGGGGESGPVESTITLADRAGIEVPVIPSVVASQPPDTLTDSVAAAPASAAPAIPDTTTAVVPPNVEEPKAKATGTPPERRTTGRTKMAGSTVQKPSPSPAPVRASPLTTPSPAPNAADSARLPARNDPRPAGVTASPGALPAPLPPSPPSTAALAFPADRGTIATGGRHSCLLGGGGRVLCWGNNEEGQLGDGTFAVRTTPTPVAGEFSFTQIVSGSWHTCGVTTGGDVYCWGKNDDGQLGDGTTAERSAPVRANSGAGFKLVRAGSAHTCALSRGGSVLCWGANASGQLGDGTRVSRASPVPVSLPAPAATLAVGGNHTCAITVDGMAYCWGLNSDGQLGDGSTVSRPTPVAVDAELRFLSVAAGGAHSCAVAQNGDAFCWGRNNYGQLGAGSSGAPSASPVPVAGALSFVTIVAGSAHTCARGRDGHAWCWGRNAYGQLGDGTTLDRSRPFTVRSLATVSALQASGAHTCGISSNGEAYCWGWNVDGQLGGGHRENTSTPSRVVPPDR
jgi:serine/threonine protein kinase/alpha-tubulin suppressor-like RCC1 family protein